MGSAEMLALMAALPQPFLASEFRARYRFAPFAHASAVQSLLAKQRVTRRALGAGDPRRRGSQEFEYRVTA